MSAVIVWGGEKVFAAGADIKEMETMSYTDMVDHSVLLQDFTRALARVPKPTVAAITGYALGGGCEVALACDFRIAADDARLGQPEILLGIIPGAGGTQRLARLVGPSKAKDLVFSGRFVKAAGGPRDRPGRRGRARRRGLRRGPRPDVAATSAARPTPCARPRRPSTAASRSTSRAGLEIERTLFAGLFATKDRATGMRSFVEQGPGKATFEGA